MKTFEQRLSEDRRITLLRLIESAAGAANDSLLATLVNDLGIRTSHDQVRTELSWLREQGLIDIEIIGDVWIAKLNHRGLDVAQGITVVPGVTHPMRTGR